MTRLQRMVRQWRDSPEGIATGGTEARINAIVYAKSCISCLSSDSTFDNKMPETSSTALPLYVRRYSHCTGIVLGLLRATCITDSRIGNGSRHLDTAVICTTTIAIAMLSNMPLTDA